MVLQVKPNSLYSSQLNQADKPVDDNVKFRLFDRVAVVGSKEIVSFLKFYVNKNKK